MQAQNEKLWKEKLSNEKEKRRKEREAWDKDRREIIVNMERELQQERKKIADRHELKCKTL